MGIAEEYLRRVRADDYKREQLNEQANALAEKHKQIDARLAIAKNEFPIIKMKYQLNKAKAVITEAVSRLYMKSLIIENADNYADTLMPVARQEIISSLSEAINMNQLHDLISKTSPYVQSIMPLAESIANNVKDAEVKEYSTKVILNPDELKLIEDFEKRQSVDIYASEIQDRVADVYKKEEERSLEQKERTQNTVNAVMEAKKKKAEDDTFESSTSEDAFEEPEEDEEGMSAIGESVACGLNLFSSTPTSIFNAIYVNKSKAILAEAAGLDISQFADDILCECICTYTLLECIHSLGLKTYDEESATRLMYEFATA